VTLLRHSLYRTSTRAYLYKTGGGCGRTGETVTRSKENILDPYRSMGKFSRARIRRGESVRVVIAHSPPDFCRGIGTKKESLWDTPRTAGSGRRRKNSPQSGIGGGRNRHDGTEIGYQWSSIREGDQ